MKYYWCVNCGYHGVFSFSKLGSAKCDSCNYDVLTKFTHEEWTSEELDKQHEIDKIDPIYDGRFKDKNKNNGR